MSLEIFEKWKKSEKHITEDNFFELAGKYPFAFLYGQGEWMIFGRGIIQSLDDLSEQIKFVRSGDLPPIFPDFIGYITYEYGYQFDREYPKIPELKIPKFNFTIYREIYVYSSQTHTLYSGKREGQWDKEELLFHTTPFKAEKIYDSESSETYKLKVEMIKSRIKKGDVYQVNLTRQEGWKISGDLSNFAKALLKENPAPYSAFIHHKAFSIVSSSPELLFRLQNRNISTFPIKGTVKRGVTEDEDTQLKQELILSEKNRAELAMITDLLRNDMSIICDQCSVKVESFPNLQSFNNVHHLVSHISGMLKPETSVRHILSGLYPGGSITGCPKISAIKIIEQLEDMPRHVYTGSIGWFSSCGKQADFNIAIRTCYIVDNTLYFGVGGGVIWDSDPADEYLETLHKASSIVRCLNKNYK